ncbi:hypothetical protein ANN_16954 [Periplaneta americana]|uniref:Uncharacterized protein n=1 Tax=Periplaneta americana TaxID=6978 RepID=A0ABQ8ST18_PERAM|nr:hypothetical protein ANN_16954 [Periplaneta americana]
MAGLCEGDNELPGSLKAIRPVYVINVYKLTPSNGPKERSRRARDLTVASDNLSAIEFRPEHFGIQFIALNCTQVIQIADYVNRPHIDVSLTCEHDPKLQEYCVCSQNMPQFDSQGIPNQAPETNKPMILNGPTSRNRESSGQETFDPSTGEPYD